MTDCAYLQAQDICLASHPKPSKNRRENDVISVTPVHVKFSTDNTSNHVVPIVVWNKTGNNVRFKILLPQTDIFQVYYNQQDIYGHSEVTFHVKCKPQNVGICVDCLEIQVQGQPGIRVCLELMPNLNWFVLPKQISLPPAPLCTRVEAKINLPVPRLLYNFCVVSPLNQFFTVTPRSGTIGPGPNSVKFLTVSFTSHEYLTLTYKLAIKFPGVESQPYEIQIHGRCVPNLTNLNGRRDVLEIEKLTGDLEKSSAPKSKPKKDPKFRLVKQVGAANLKSGPSMEEGYKEMKKMMTPAGIMKFLLQKSSFDSNSLLGPLGVEMSKSIGMYQEKRAEFAKKLHRLSIQQENLLHQHHKQFLGTQSIDLEPELVNKIKLEREHFVNEYKKGVGMENDESEDLSRIKLKKFNQRQITNKTKLPLESVTHGLSHDPENSNQLKPAILKPFVQAARLLITRWRADQRLKKLAKLVQDQKQAQEAERMAREKEPEVTFKYPDADDQGGQDYQKDKKFYTNMNQLRSQVQNEELKSLIDKVNVKLSKLRQNVNENLQRIKKFIEQTQEKPKPDVENDLKLKKDDLAKKAQEAAKRHNDLHDQMTRLNATIKNLQDKVEVKSKNEVNDPVTNLIEEKLIKESLINKEIENLLDSNSPLHLKYKEEQKVKDQVGKVNEAFDDLQRKIFQKDLLNLKKDFNKEINRLLGLDGTDDDPKINEVSLAVDSLEMFRNVSPEQLEELLQCVNVEIEKIPLKYRTPRLLSVQEGVNKFIQKIMEDVKSFQDDPSGEKKLMKKRLDKINSEIEKLKKKMADDENINRLQNDLNSELGEGTASYSRKSSRTSSRKSSRSRSGSSKIKDNSTANKIKEHQERLNEQINKLPESYETLKMKEIQQKMNHNINKYLQQLNTTPQLKLENDVNAFKDKFNADVVNLQDNLIEDLKSVASDQSIASGVSGLSDQRKSVQNIVNKYQDELSQLENGASNDLEKLKQKEDQVLNEEMIKQLDKINLDIKKLQLNIGNNPELAGLQKELSKQLGFNLAPNLIENGTNKQKKNSIKRLSQVNKLDFEELIKLVDLINKNIKNLPEKFKSEQVKQISKSIDKLTREIIDKQIDINDSKQYLMKQQVTKQVQNINQQVDKLQELIVNPHIFKLQKEFNKVFNLPNSTTDATEKISKKFEGKVPQNLSLEQLKNFKDDINVAISKLPSNFKSLPAVKNLQDGIKNYIKKVKGGSIIFNDHFDMSLPRKKQIKKQLNDITNHLDDLQNLIGNPHISLLEQDLLQYFNNILDPTGIEKEFNQGETKLIDESQLSTKINAKDLETIQDNLNRAINNLPEIFKQGDTVNKFQEGVNSVINKILREVVPVAENDVEFHFNQLDQEEKNDVRDILKEINFHVDKLDYDPEILKLQQKCYQDFNNILGIDNIEESQLKKLIHSKLPSKLNVEQLQNLQEQVNTIINQLPDKIKDSLPVQNLQQGINSSIDEMIQQQEKHLLNNLTAEEKEELKQKLNEIIVQVDKLENYPDIFKFQQDFTNYFNKILELPQKQLNLNKLSPKLSVQQLQQIQDNIHNLIEQLPAKFKQLNAIKKLQDGVNSTLNKVIGDDLTFLNLNQLNDKESQDLKQKLENINNRMDKLPKNVKSQVEKTQQIFNDTFNKLLNLPDEVVLKRKSVGSSSQEKEWTSKELKSLRQNINDSFHQLSNNLKKVNLVNNLQKQVNSLINKMINDDQNLINDPLHHQDKKELIDTLQKINREIGKLQQKIGNFELEQVVNNFNHHFNKLLLLPNDTYDALKSLSPPIKKLGPSSKLNHEELSTMKNNIKNQLDKFPEKFRTSIVHDLENTVNTVVDKMSHDADFGGAQPHLGINNLMNELQGRVDDPEIAGLQKELNDEFKSLGLDHPDGGQMEMKLPEEQTDKKEITLEELEHHLEKLDREFDQLPEQYKTENVRKLQLKIQDSIKKLHEKITHHLKRKVSSVDMTNIIDLGLQIQQDISKFLPTIKRINFEIDNLQKKIISSDLWRLQEELNWEFEYLVTNNHIPNASMSKWRPNKLAWDGSVLKKPKINQQEFLEHAQKISQAFNEIPERYRTSITKQVESKIRKLLKKFGDQLENCGDKKILKEQHEKINIAMDQLNSKVGHREITRLQNLLNDELKKLIGLPFDPEIDTKFQHRASLSTDHHESQVSLTLEELKYHLTNINNEINKIPLKYQTNMIQNIQHGLNDAVKELEDRILQQNSKSPQGRLSNEIDKTNKKFIEQVQNLKNKLLDMVNQIVFDKVKSCNVEQVKKIYDDIVDQLNDQMKYEIDRLQFKLKTDKNIINKYGLFQQIKNLMEFKNHQISNLKDMVNNLVNNLKQKFKNLTDIEKTQRRLRLKLLESRKSRWALLGRRSGIKKVKSKSKLQLPPGQTVSTFQTTTGEFYTRFKRPSYYSRMRATANGSWKKLKDPNCFKSLQSPFEMMSPFVTEPTSMSRLLTERSNKKDHHHNHICGFYLSDESAEKLVQELKIK